MLVDVGFPWEGDFCLVSELLPRFCWWIVIDVCALLRWAQAKWSWNSFQNRFVHFNSLLSLHIVAVNEGVCVCVKELALAVVFFRDHVWVKQFGWFSSCSSLSGSWAESLLLKGLFHFLLSIFVQQSTLAHQAVWLAWWAFICWAELRARAYSLCYVCLSVSESLGTAGVPSERWSVCGYGFFCEMQFIQIWESRDWKMEELSCRDSL